MCLWEEKQETIILCTLCKRRNHLSCVGLTEETMKDQLSTFRCPSCPLMSTNECLAAINIPPQIINQPTSSSSLPPLPQKTLQIRLHPKQSEKNILSNMGEVSNLFYNRLLLISLWLEENNIKITPTLLDDLFVNNHVYGNCCSCHLDFKQNKCDCCICNAISCKCYRCSVKYKNKLAIYRGKGANYQFDEVKKAMKKLAKKQKQIEEGCKLSLKKNKE